MSLSSRGSYSVIWRWSGDGSDRPNQQGNRCLSRSDSLEEWMCPPLPGQVPVGPSETSNGRTVQGAVEEASPVNKSSTGESEIRLGGVKCTDRDSDISCVKLAQVFYMLTSGHIYCCSAIFS